MSESEFDSFASQYEQCLKESAGLLGGDMGYYNQTKAEVIRDVLGGHAGSILEYGCGIGGVIPHLARLMPAAALSGATCPPRRWTLAPAGIRRQSS